MFEFDVYGHGYYEGRGGPHLTSAEIHPDSFLATRTLEGFTRKFVDSGVLEKNLPHPDMPKPQTLSNGLKLPERFDWMTVKYMPDEKNPLGFDPRSYQFGLREFLLTINIDEVPGSNEQAYEADIHVYGMTDADIETALGYYERKVWFTRCDTCTPVVCNIGREGVEYHLNGKDVHPTWQQKHDPTGRTYPTLKIKSITRHQQEEFYSQEIKFGKHYLSLVFEHYDGVAVKEGLTQQQAFENELVFNMFSSYIHSHWGVEGTFGPNLLNEMETQDPFTAFYADGALIDGNWDNLAGLDTEFWLHLLGKAMGEYRTRGAGADAEFERLMGREFGEGA